MSPTMHRIVKTEPGVENIDHITNTPLIEQKARYEQEINRLKKAHDEQVYRLCNELEKSSLMIHQFKSELDTMRLALNFKENQLKTRGSDSFIQDLQATNAELHVENIKLKEELELLRPQHKMLFNEVQDARQYVQNLIASLD